MKDNLSTELIPDEKDTLDTLEKLLDLTGDIMLALDIKGRVVIINDPGCRLLGLSEKEILGKNWFSDGFMTSDVSGDLKSSISSVTQDKKFSFEGNLITSSGVIKYITWHIKTIIDKYKNTQKILMSGEETSKTNFISTLDPVMAYNSYKEKEYGKIISAVMDGYFALDTQGRFLDANRAYCDMTGYSKSELLKMTVTDIDCTETRDQTLSRIAWIIANRKVKFETRHRRKDGIMIDVENSVCYLEGPGRIYAFARDITTRKQREGEILYLTYHDKLTGLYNYTFYMAEKERLDLSRLLPISVIMGDVNGLKLINDAFGHSVGDEYIVSISQVLKSCCRKEDILARTGGDEFIILLVNTTRDDVQAVCRRITKACVNKKIVSGSSTLFMSISLGYATKSSQNESLDDIIKEAEAFMYRRKLLESKSMHSSLMATIRSTMFEKSHETQEHAARLAKLSKSVGIRMNMTDKELNELELFSLLHDIGKMSIGDEILQKKDPLSASDWDEIKKHPEVGYRIALAVPGLVPVAKHILCHHERYDGLGYPQGISGDDIPLMARILSIVDAYDSMTNDRPYRKALSRDVAIAEIKKNSGTQFDPLVVDVFLEII